jgi:hypothetical protein
MITVIYFWRVKRTDIPFALFRMAIDRTLLRRSSGVTFAKMFVLGTAFPHPPPSLVSNQENGPIGIRKNGSNSPLKISMKLLEKAAFSASYQSVWCAGTSVEFSEEIQPIEAIVKKLIFET